MTGSQLYIITVHGKVQGVYFRKYTQAKATELGVNGFVMNQADGTVYIEAEGTHEALNQFLEWCHIGSPSAKVKSVDSLNAESKGYSSFEIHR